MRLDILEKERANGVCQMARKRFIIAVLLNQLEGRYQSSIWHGMEAAARESGVDLVLFPGKSPGTTDLDEARHNILYDLIDPDFFDGFVIASGVLSNYIGPEGLLDFCRPFSRKPMVSISLELPGIPSVMIDNASGMRALLEHLIEDHKYTRFAFVRGPQTNVEAESRYSIFAEVMRDRELDIQPGMMIRGDFTRASGARAMQTLWDLEGERPEAVVFANDDMAYAAYAWARKQGIRIPDDLAMAGFDDIEEMRFLPSPFTTVSQPSFEQAYTAITLLVSRLHGESIPELTRLPTRLVLRQSCGCDRERPLPRPDNSSAPCQCDLIRDKGLAVAEKFFIPVLQQMDVPEKLWQHFQDDIRGLIHAMGEDLGRGQGSLMFEQILEETLVPCSDQGLFLDFCVQLFRILRTELLAKAGDQPVRSHFEIIFQRLVVLSKNHTIWQEAGRRLRLEYLAWYMRGVNQRLSLSMEPEALYPMISRELSKLGVVSAYLVLFERDLLRSGERVLPEVRLVSGYGPEGDCEAGVLYPTGSLLPGGLLQTGRRRSLIIKPLFSAEIQLGFLIMEVSDIEDTLYETLRGTISDALIITLLFEEHKKQARQLYNANAELSSLNKHLQDLSQRDELTGLYNRRGFMTLAEHECRTAVRRGGAFVLFFADLDGLKWINDELGHEFGDEAITAAARVLESTFRQTDILARLGGDEYVVFATDATAAFAREIGIRLEEEIAIYNRGEHPYRLAISVGMAVYSGEGDVSLERVMAEADSELYKEKKRREHLGLRLSRKQ